MNRFFYFIFDNRRSDDDFYRETANRGADRSHDFYNGGATIGRAILMVLMFVIGFVIAQVVTGAALGVWDVLVKVLNA